MKSSTIPHKKTVTRTELEISVITVPEKKIEIRRTQMRMALETLVVMIMMAMVS